MPAHEKAILFRTSEENHIWLALRAEDNGRSVNSELNQIIKKLRQEEETKKKGK